LPKIPEVLLTIEVLFAIFLNFKNVSIFKVKSSFSKFFIFFKRVKVEFAISISFYQFKNQCQILIGLPSLFEPIQ